MSSPATTAKVAVVVAPPEVLEATVAPLDVLHHGRVLLRPP